MAILYRNSLDGHTTVSQRFNSTNGSPSIGAFGRCGTNGLNCDGGGSPDWVQTSLPSNEATLGVALAFRPTDPSITQDTPLIQLMDGGSIQTDLRYDTQGRFYFTRNGTLIGARSASALFKGQYVHLELKVTIDNAAGVIELRVNGSSTGWIPSTGSLDTQNTANAFVNAVRVGCIGGSINEEFDFDDIFVWNTSGAAPTNFIGDTRIEWRSANADGSQTDWANVGDATDVACVNDNPPNDDTDYISSATATDENLFTQTALTTTAGTIYEVAVVLRHRKDDAGSRTVRAEARSGVTTGEGGDITVSDSYATTATSFATNPDTAAAWTIAEVNAGEFGVKLQA